MALVWKTGILRDICSLREQVVNPHQWTGQHVTLFSVPSFDAGRMPEVVSAESLKSAKNSVRPGDVLFCKMNPRKNRVWSVSGFQTEHAICSSEFLPLVTNGVVIPEFLELILKSPQFQREAQSKAKAATKSRERINPRDVLKLPVAWLESQEQQKDAASQVNDQLAKQARLRLAAERQFEASSTLPVGELRSVFSLQDLSAGWVRRPISELVRADGQQIDSREAEFITLPFLGLENIESGTGRFVILEDQAEPGRSACFRFGPQHVLYGKLRPYLNKVFLPDSNGRCALEILPLLPCEGFNREFVAAVLRSPPVVAYTTKHSTGGRMPRADIRKLMRFEVPMPEARNACNQLGVQLNSRLNSCSVVHSAVARQLEAVSALPPATLRQFFNLS